MNSINNDSYEIAAAKVFCDLYALIKEDEKEIEHNKHEKDYSEYKVYENNVSSSNFNITEDELNKIKNKDDMTEIFNIINSYDKELVSTVQKNWL